MKKMLPVLLAALVGLAGCSKKEDATPAAKTITVSNTAIFGTWQRTNWTETSTVNGVTTVTNSTNYPTGSITQTYTEQGVYSPRTQGVGTDGTYTYTGSTLTMYIDGKTSATTVETINATTLVFSAPGGGALTERYTLRR